MGHSRRVYCNIETCRYNRIGFDKKTALDKHSQNFHEVSRYFPVPPKIRRVAKAKVFRLLLRTKDDSLEHSQPQSIQGIAAQEGQQPIERLQKTQYEGAFSQSQGEEVVSASNNQLDAAVNIQEMKHQPTNLANYSQFVRYYHVQKQQGEFLQGWQNSIAPEERGQLTSQFFTQFRLLKPETPEQQAVRIALNYETQEFMQASAKDPYVAEIKQKLIQMTAVRQQQLQRMQNNRLMNKTNPGQMNPMGQAWSRISQQSMPQWTSCGRIETKGSHKCRDDATTVCDATTSAPGASSSSSRLATSPLNQMDTMELGIPQGFQENTQQQFDLGFPDAPLQRPNKMFSSALNDGTSDLNQDRSNQHHDLQKLQRDEAFINQLAKRLLDSCGPDIRAKFQSEVNVWPEETKVKLLSQELTLYTIASDSTPKSYTEVVKFSFQNGKILNRAHRKVSIPWIGYTTKMINLGTPRQGNIMQFHLGHSRISIRILNRAHHKKSTA
ncbi:hypothetical protein BU25DRAFT_420526 [Macroventuria anomochaeta]|uniref:Uncharacterized protein n=1 Tax=Macroventuria anomochaeta TaxID=301207 RepID=A0ACB6S500_9PLEO|nr:uncharacterized protein BU25DRAFT_420526 [Macroventuria anomochaeta]KAF2629118.1 hypothetical protein BU25DRAFT_420526 [Macroventuria anomochaeta]